jgi:hypothetical protein
MEMATIIYGTVDSDGTILGGSGYSVSHTSGTGLYYITFDEPFNKLPGAAGTQLYPNVETNDGGDTRDNVVFVFLSAEKLVVKTGDNDGDARDRNFTFIVAGD